MHLATTGIVCAVRGHGEHNAVARLLTAEAGMLPGYVRGGRSRRLRPVLMAGNLVAADFRARSEEQLAALTVELVHSRAALVALLDAIEAAPAARDWASVLVRFELLLLAELGFGLDLARCAATGAGGDLAWVSPKSGQAVGRAAGAPHAARLLPLPGFLIDGGAAEWDAVLDGLRLTGFFLERDLLAGRQGAVLAARERLVERIRRVAG